MADANHRESSSLYIIGLTFSSDGKGNDYYIDSKKFVHYVVINNFLAWIDLETFARALNPVATAGLMIVLFILKFWRKSKVTAILTVLS